MLKPNESVLRSLGPIPEGLDEAGKRLLVARSLLNTLRKDGYKPYHNGRVVYLNPDEPMPAEDQANPYFQETKEELLFLLGQENSQSIEDALIVVESALRPLRKARPGRPNRDFTMAVVAELNAMGEKLAKLAQRFAEHDQVGPSDFHKQYV